MTMHISWLRVLRQYWTVGEPTLLKRKNELGLPIIELSHKVSILFVCLVLLLFLARAEHKLSRVGFPKTEPQTWSCWVWRWATHYCLRIALGWVVGVGPLILGCCRKTKPLLGNLFRRFLGWFLAHFILLTNGPPFCNSWSFPSLHGFCWRVWLTAILWFFFSINYLSH